MDNLLYTFVQDLGLGELPILTEDNRSLNEDLAAKQLEIAKFQKLNSEEKETVDRIFGHWNNIKESGEIFRQILRSCDSTMIEILLPFMCFMLQLEYPKMSKCPSANLSKVSRSC